MHSHTTADRPVDTVCPDRTALHRTALHTHYLGSWGLGGDIGENNPTPSSEKQLQHTCLYRAILYCTTHLCTPHILSATSLFKTFAYSVPPTAIFPPSSDSICHTLSLYSLLPSSSSLYSSCLPSLLSSCSSLPTLLLPSPYQALRWSVWT